jgi:SAM-dependent methyltransferase
MNKKCPLCNFEILVLTKEVETAPLRAYWEDVGYRLEAHHEAFPEKFSVFSCVQCGLGTFFPQAVGGSVLYEALGCQGFYYPSTRWDHQTALRFLQSRHVESILEFGCGDGKFLDYGSRIAKESVGFDFNSEAVAQARNRGLNVYEQWDGLPFRQYQAVVTFQTLEHLPDPGDVIRQLVERVKPGGYLIVAVPNEDGPLGKLIVNPLNAPPHHASLWPRSALEYIAKAHGLELETYAKEPINQALYFTLVGESVNEVMKGGGLFVRILQKALRWKIYADASLAFVENRSALDGHNHIAIYSKPRSHD